MYDEQEIEIDRAMQDWMLGKRFTADAKTNAAIRERVEALLESGGYVSTSHFERAYLELLDEDAIQPFRGALGERPTAAPAIPPDVIAWIENPRVSSFEQRRRYSTDKEFKRYYDLYANQQLKAKVAEETSGIALTVEEYRSLPAATLIQRYRREKGFKIAVDALIAKGLIALVLGLLHGGLI
jgi:hypothetical protein